METADGYTEMKWNTLRMARVGDVQHNQQSEYKRQHGAQLKVSIRFEQLTNLSVLFNAAPL